MCIQGVQFDLNAHIIFKKGSVQIDYSLFEHNMMELNFTNFNFLKNKYILFEKKQKFRYTIHVS